MTNKFKEAKLKGLSGSDAAAEALSGSINSVIVSALTFFAATFGVGIYSDIDMISSLCVLMARGAVISMIVVIFILPAFLRLFSKVITATSLSFKEGNVAENKYETSDYDENKDRYSYQ